jgi:hypothetical protein
VKTSSFNQPTVNSEAPTFFFVFFESIPSRWAKAMVETGFHQPTPINQQKNKETVHGDVPESVKSDGWLEID